MRRSKPFTKAINGRDLKTWAETVDDCIRLIGNNKTMEVRERLEILHSIFDELANQTNIYDKKVPNENSR